ncbi:MAG: hypothetical protein IPI89_12250 [Propionivibrio sp.]|nr:hypothetical protein [Propionivibrio sp.]
MKKNIIPHICSNPSVFESPFRSSQLAKFSATVAAIAINAFASQEVSAKKKNRNVQRALSSEISMYAPPRPMALHVNPVSAITRR